MRRLPWRRPKPEPFWPAVSAASRQLQAENAELRATLRDVRNQAMADRTSLGAERRTGREQKEELAAVRNDLKAALKGCEDKCPHARVADERQVQLTVMQQRFSELQAANERRDSPGFAPRIPDQRGHL